MTDMLKKLQEILPQHPFLDDRTKELIATLENIEKDNILKKEKKDK
jgi:hypothetical protein